MDLPEESLGYILLNTVLVFLMLNYNMPLGTVYFAMVVVDTFSYLLVSLFRTFTWIPFAKEHEPKIIKYIIGIVFGVGFLYIYNYISKLPMAAVFATTAFGDSKLLTILVFSLLIAPVETRLFFRTLMQVVANLFGHSFRSSPFSASGLFLMAFFGAVFTVFHLTAKGISNTPELVATFVFGALSVGMVLYFQEWVQAGIMHIVVNAKAMGLFDAIPQIMQYWYSWVVVGAVAFIAYKSAKKRGTNILGI